MCRFGDVAADAHSGELPRVAEVGEEIQLVAGVCETRCWVDNGGLWCRYDLTRTWCAELACTADRVPDLDLPTTNSCWLPARAKQWA